MKIGFRILIFLIILGFSAPNFAFPESQPINSVKIQNETEITGKKILNSFPQALKITGKEVLAIGPKIISGFKKFWYPYVSPWLKKIWHKIKSFLGKEAEKRKPEIQEEFKTEKEEMKEEIPKISKSLWERFKDLIK